MANGSSSAAAASVATGAAEGPSSTQEEGAKGAPVDTSRWVQIYPAYLDKRKSQAEGRKVSADVAVTAPHAIEMFKICGELGVVAKLELNKTYPRDFFSRGRVRVKLYKDADDREPMLPNVRNRKELYKFIAMAFSDFRARNGSLEKHGDPMSLVSLGVTKSSESKAASSSSSAAKKKGKKR